MNGSTEAKRASAAARLRWKLADFEWHSNFELMQPEIAGPGMGQRLHELHRKHADPLHYEKQTDPENDSLVKYRQTLDASKCSLCSKPASTNLRAQLRIRDEQIARLTERLQELEGCR